MHAPTTGPPGSEIMDALDTLLDKANGIDWDLASGPELTAAIEEVAVITAKVESLRSKVAAAVDHSGLWSEHHHANAAAMLRTRRHNRRPTEASRDVRLGWRLRMMPHVAAAFEAGRITSDHVSVLGTCLHQRFDGQFAEFEEQLVANAIALPWDDFVKLIDAWKDHADAGHEDERDRRDSTAREVHLSRSLRNRGIMRGTLTPLARSIVRNELDRLADLMFRDEWAAAVERLGEGNVSRDDVSRTPAQRRHDALVWMAMRSASVGDHNDVPPAMIYVHTTEADLADAVAEFGDGGRPTTERVEHTSASANWQTSQRELDDGTRLSRRTLRRLLANARVRRIVHGPADEVISAGRARRFFSRSQRDVVAARDRVCACGCGLPARMCDIDHVVEWRDGGCTDVSNAQPLCRGSHSRKTAARTGQPGMQ